MDYSKRKQNIIKYLRYMCNKQNGRISLYDRCIIDIINDALTQQIILRKYVKAFKQDNLCGLIFNSREYYTKIAEKEFIELINVLDKEVS